VFSSTFLPIAVLLRNLLLVFDIHVREEEYVSEI